MMDLEWVLQRMSLGHGEQSIAATNAQLHPMDVLGPYSCREEAGKSLMALARSHNNS